MEPTSLQTLGDKELYDFLVNCPKDFRENERIRKFQLKNGDYIHCVLWNFHFYVSGTDIVKILIWRFQNAGRQIGAIKKFEEGVFSDLRNLKPGVDATLEGPRSEFLEFLYKNGCIRTQKKQKVFYWYSVPHDELFFDALERDMRRDSSIYAYNRLVQDPQCMRMPDSNPLPCFPKFGCTVPPASEITGGLFNGMDKPMAGKGIEAVRSRDIFDVKDALFGGMGGLKSRSVDLFGNFRAKEYGVPKAGDMELFGGGAQGDYNNLKNSTGTDQPRDSRSSSVRASGHIVVPSSTGVDEGAEGPYNCRLYEGLTEGEMLGDHLLNASSQRSKKTIEKAMDFDDFDLGQFDFLKERCKEHFSRKGETCEQKLFEENGKDEKITSIDRMGEIRFIGSKDRN